MSFVATFFAHSSGPALFMMRTMVEANSTSLYELACLNSALARAAALCKTEQYVAGRMRRWNDAGYCHEIFTNRRDCLVRRGAYSDKSPPHWYEFDFRPERRLYVVIDNCPLHFPKRAQCTVYHLHDQNNVDWCKVMAEIVLMNGKLFKFFYHVKREDGIKVRAIDNILPWNEETVDITGRFSYGVSERRGMTVLQIDGEFEMDWLGRQKCIKGQMAFIYRYMLLRISSGAFGCLD